MGCITYPFLNFNGWSLRMDKLFQSTFYNKYNYFSMLGLKLIHVSEMSPNSIDWRKTDINLQFPHWGHVSLDVINNKHDNRLINKHLSTIYMTHNPFPVMYNRYFYVKIDANCIVYHLKEPDNHICCLSHWFYMCCLYNQCICFSKAHTFYEQLMHTNIACSSMLPNHK